MSQVAQILACYRKNCSTPAPMGQLILPESMKLLPLYSNCVVKSDALQGGEYLAQVLVVLSQQILSFSVIELHEDFYLKNVPVCVINSYMFDFQGLKSRQMTEVS